MQRVIRRRQLQLGVVKILTMLVLAAVVTACGGARCRAPVDNLEQPPSQKISVHVVAKGETLYSIAWRYNMDVRALARANRIPEPYTIYPGQRVNLDLRASPPMPGPSVSVAPSREPIAVERSNNRSTPAPKSGSGRTHESELGWQWPVNGTLLARFSGPQALNKGIDIGAEKGEPVVAAESGTVVYAGNGLRGYGNLLIIKHDRNYLSAYAHNNKLLAAEGDTVEAGQQIAEVGSSGTDRDKLHFEIRRDGQPVDPLRYLPGR